MGKIKKLIKRFRLITFYLYFHNTKILKIRRGKLILILNTIIT